MALTAPPTAPDTNDPTTFDARADAHIAWQATNVTEMNAFQAALTSIAAGTAFSIPYTFSTTTTDSDPGAGFLRLDNATQNTATTIRADLVGADTSTWTGVLDTFDDSTSTVKGQILLVKLADATKWLAFNVTALASPTGYKNITVANVASSTASPFVNGDSIALQFTRTGDIGPAGSAGLDDLPTIIAGGTVDAITATFSPAITLSNYQKCCVISSGANTSTAPTFAPNGLTARTITTRGGGLLVAGDIGAAGFVMMLEYNLANTRWELLNPVSAKLGANTFTGAQNMSRATVASHATTADIWGALGNQIDWTGTATTTIFPNAPQAGAERVLICAGACSFTAGANMLIDGVSSGSTVTCAANDQVIVRAVSTTQFKLSRIKYDGTSQVAPLSSLVRSVRTSNIILAAADNNTLIDITSGTFTQTFTAAATLGSGWYCIIKNSGTGDITLDPNASETIDGLTSYVMYPGESRLIQCGGAAFTSIVLSPFYRVFTSSSTFTKPPGYSVFDINAWGAGGGGGSGAKSSNNDGCGGGGGGGGAFKQMSLLSSLIGTTETITIGAGGSGGSSQATNITAGIAGTSGGQSSFGTLVIAYGGNNGGGGYLGSSSASSPGGTGGGSLANSAPVDGDGALNSEATAARGFGGGSSYSNGNGGASGFGGGAGGSAMSTMVDGKNGGGSAYGGAGGGGGAGNQATSDHNGGDGGRNTDQSGSGGVGGNASTSTAPVAPTTFGYGGGGGYYRVTTTAGNSPGANGAIAGGGGGGAAGLNNSFNSGAGGNGGRGEVKIWGIA